MSRCYEPSNASYKAYGGRGIEVHPYWHTVEHFLADMGPRPPHKSLDRIDGTKNYEPRNCRWASITTQTANKRPPRLRKATTEMIGDIKELRRCGLGFREIGAVVGLSGSRTHQLWHAQ